MPFWIKRDSPGTLNFSGYIKPQFSSTSSKSIIGSLNLLTLLLPMYKPTGHINMEIAGATTSPTTTACSSLKAQSNTVIPNWNVLSKKTLVGKLEHDATTCPADHPPKATGQVKRGCRPDSGLEPALTHEDRPRNNFRIGTLFHTQLSIISQIQFSMGFPWQRWPSVFRPFMCSIGLSTFTLEHQLLLCIRLFSLATLQL